MANIITLPTSAAEPIANPNRRRSGAPARNVTKVNDLVHRRRRREEAKALIEAEESPGHALRKAVRDALASHFEAEGVSVDSLYEIAGALLGAASQMRENRRV